MSCSSENTPSRGDSAGGGSTGTPSTGGNANGTGNASNGGGDPAGTGGDSPGNGGSSGSDGTGGSDTGGSGTGGGTSENPSYPHGFTPTTITSAHADAAYARWKENWLVSCPGGAYRVEWDHENQTVSEGIAYGMLMAVAHDDRDVFDGLWLYYKNNVNERGFMHWRRVGCEGTAFDQNSNNGASDADLDAAMALTMAECRWGAEYSDDATGLIAALLQHQTLEEGGLRLLLPGDDKNAFNAGDCLNASYFAPGYYRAFAERPQTSAADAAQWTRLADDSYVLIDRMAHPGTGLVPNWADASGDSYDGGPSGCNWYNEPHIYGADAIRTPWRISTDYVWWGTPAAKPWLDKVTDWVRSQGITEVLRRYLLDGTPSIPPEPGRQENSILAVGAFAAGAMAYDQATVDEFTAHAVSLQEDPPRYYVDSLRALYFLQLSGRFTTCGGK